MEVSDLLAHDSAPAVRSSALSNSPCEEDKTLYRSTAMSSRRAGDGQTTPNSNFSYQGSQTSTPTPYTLSPQSSTVPKYVAFELVFQDSPNYRARLPMRVNIFPHDTTDSIVTTVKNFYGLYEGPGGPKGISFEDASGNTLIARYENFQNNMTVSVRVILDAAGSPSAYYPPSHQSASIDGSRQGFHAADRDRMSPKQPAQALTYGEAPPSRPESRVARIRSLSPNSGRGRRSVSANGKGQIKVARSRSGLKSRGSSTHGVANENLRDLAVTYSSDEGDRESTTSSRKARSEQLASAEISLDNIVEGGRRKRAKFDSSELPLFVPPQVPLTASMSSMSPTRQPQALNTYPNFVHPGYQNYSYNQPLPSPMSLGNTSAANGHSHGPSFSTPPAPFDRKLRNRNGDIMPSPKTFVRPRNGAGPGAMPTPDPTVASTISDEDVALQLMRLGEASMISSTTRNSASTLDDALSGAADAASSESETSASDDESEDVKQSRAILAAGLGHLNHPDRYRQGEDQLKSSDSNYPSDKDDEIKDGNFMDGYANGQSTNDHRKKSEKGRTVIGGINKSRNTTAGSKSSKSHKPKPASSTKSKGKASHVSGSGTGSATPSRNGSTAGTVNFQPILAEDEEDLSSKPRCQRCRKSKKGCDRQRPCQRCKDAGLGADDCISEDEGNGRKGRYGRHMGVPVKKQSIGTPTLPAHQPEFTNGVEISTADAVAQVNSKKRKR